MLTYELERDFNNGRLLELYFHDEVLQNIPIVRILHETQLRRMFGWFACSVDFLIEFDDGIVLVQCKYKNTRRRENFSIKNFIKSIEVIKSQYKKPFLFGLWISKLDPFEDNKHWLSNHNIHYVSDYQSLDKLIYSAINFIQTQKCTKII